MESNKDKLLRIISSAPSNAATSRDTTRKIIDAVRDLESSCPTLDENVIDRSAGSWELLWTAQDQSSEQARSLSPWNRFINPLENQSYSNNPNGQITGRANPFLPQDIQKRLEDLGIVSQDTDPVRSSQTIDMKRQQVRNVVSFNVPSLLGKSRKASVTVIVGFTPNSQDSRKIDVKFQECRAVVPSLKFDLSIPLGIIGPTGWLRTVYLDDTIRITRGHKGSIFVLTRPSVKASKT